MAPTPTARSADLLLLNRAARLDRGRGLLIAHVDDAPRDAFSARERQDLRKTARRHARSFYGRSTARVRPQPLRTCSLPVAAALRPTIHRQTMPGQRTHRLLSININIIEGTYIYVCGQWTVGATSDELHLEKIWLKFNRSYYFEWFLIDRSSSPSRPSTLEAFSHPTDRTPRLDLASAIALTLGTQSNILK